MKIPIVDEQDNILYVKDRQERDKKSEIVRVTAIWLVNEKGEFLLAKRAKVKKSSPDLWGPSVLGTFEEGDTYESNALKELEEELGVNSVVLAKGPKSRISSNHEYFCQWFFADVSSNSQFILQADEVDEVKWISKDDLKTWYRRNPEEFVLAFDVCLEVIEIYENQS